MSEEEQKYFKGLIGFTFDSDDIKYIEKIVDKKDKEIERLNKELAFERQIKKEVREYIKTKYIAQGGITSYEVNDLLNELLEILDKTN